MSGPAAPMAMPETDRPDSNRGIPLLLALVVGFLVGAAGASIALGPRPEAARLAAELGDFVPVGTRGVLIADVDRLRAAPVLAPILGAALPNEPCESRLLRRVQRVLVVVGGSLDEIGFAFTGGLSREALVACARSRGGGNAQVTTSHRDGIDRVRVAPPSRGEFLPPVQGSEIVYLPRGMVLAGESSMVERMFDRAHIDNAQREAPTALDVLRARIGTGHDVVAAWALAPGDLGSFEAEPALQHVTGVALGLDVGRDVRVVAIVACDSYDAPRDVADALDRLRTAVSTQLPALAANLHDAVIERRATDVRVSITVTSETLSALANLL